MTAPGHRIATIAVFGLLLAAAVSGGVTATEPRAEAIQPGPSRHADAPLASGSTFWQGQELFFDASAILPADPTTDQRTFRIRRATDTGTGGLVDTVVVDADGTAIVDTASLDGEYVLTQGSEVIRTNATGDAVAIEGETTDTVEAGDWEVEPQSLAVALDEDDPPVRAEETTSITVDSNRANFVLNVSAADRDAETLEAALDRPGNTIAYVDDDNGVVGVRAGADTSLNASFAQAGTYDLSFSPGDATADASLTVDVAESDVSLRFPGDRVFRDQAGDVVNVTVDLNGTNEAWVFVGNVDANFLERVGVEDGDGDGRVNLSIDTTTVGDADGDGYSVAEDDEIIRVTQFAGGATADHEPLPGLDLRAQPKTGGALDSGTYDLRVASTPGTTIDGGELTVDAWQDGAILHLRPGELTSITAMAAPGTIDDGSPEAIVENATPVDGVAIPDYLVVRVNASGVYGTLEDGNLGSLYQQGLELRVVEANPRPNTVATELDLVGDGTDLHTVPAENTFYAIVELDEVPTVNRTTIREDRAYSVSFSQYGGDEELPEYPSGRTDESPYVEEDTINSVETSVTIEAADAAFPDLPRTDDLDAYQVTPGRNVHFLGSTTLAPGSEMTVRLRGTDAYRFIRERTAVVTADGYFLGAFDLRDVPVGTQLEASIRRDGRTLETVDVQVVESIATPTPEPTATPEPTPTATPQTPTATATTTPTPSVTPTISTPTETPPPTTTGGQPGFGILAGLAAAGLVVLLRWRP